MLLGEFEVDFESVWVGLELICARCAAGLAVALRLLYGCGDASFGLVLVVLGQSPTTNPKPDPQPALIQTSSSQPLTQNETSNSELPPNQSQ